MDICSMNVVVLVCVYLYIYIYYKVVVLLNELVSNRTVHASDLISGKTIMTTFSSSGIYIYI